MDNSGEYEQGNQRFFEIVACFASVVYLLDYALRPDGLSILLQVITLILDFYF